MPSINEVILLGHLGKDPELKYTQGGKTVCNASIATERSWRKADDWVKSTTWSKVVAWGKLADGLGTATKGDLVLIKGELTQRSWENKAGEKQYVTEVLAKVLVVVGKEQRKSTEASEAEGPPPDDDVPF